MKNSRFVLLALMTAVLLPAFMVGCFEDDTAVVVATPPTLPPVTGDNAYSPETLPTEVDAWTHVQSLQHQAIGGHVIIGMRLGVINVSAGDGYTFPWQLLRDGQVIAEGEFVAGTSGVPEAKLCSNCTIDRPDTGSHMYDLLVLTNGCVSVNQRSLLIRP